MAAVFGKYQLIAQLGEGGMAQVFLAVVAGPRGSGFSKLTVVKRLRASFEDEPEFITMLVDEARIAARLNHPNVVQTHEVGEVDGKYFLAMEYLDGHPLHRMQNRSRALLAKSNGKEDGGFTKEMGYVILLDVLAGLHHAHELADYDGKPLGIVHRDVTPQNLFVTYEGQVKVVDFGVAKATGRGSETRHGVIKGKVRYMAPEQAIGKDVDRRADIFSVGLLLWEIALGERRWQQESEVSIVRALLADDAYIPPDQRAVSAPPEIEAILQKALAKKPEDRFQTCEEFRKELEKYLASTGKLIETRSQIGPTVAAMFKDKRDELRACIEKQLTAVSNAESEMTPMMLSVHTDGERSSKRDLSAFSAPPTTGSVSAPIDLTASHALAKRRNGMIAVGVVAIAVIGMVVVFSSTRKDPAPANPVASITPAATQDQVAITINATPPTARILLDGVQVFSPYDVKVARTSTPHTLKIEADGFEPQSEVITFDRSVARSVSLSKLPEPAAPTTPTPTAPKATGFIAAMPRANPVKADPTKAPSVSIPPSAPTAAAAQPTAAETAAAKKRDIDRSNPFSQGTGQPKAVDKSNPFGK